MVDVNEFLKNDEPLPSAPDERGTADDSTELDIQKAVVESLAEDKVKMELEFSELKKKVEELTAENAAISKERDAAASETESLRMELARLRGEMDRMGAALAANAEGKLSTQVTLLERDVDLPDRFEGEMRDHVIEAVREARNKAEECGRVRCAQVLEAVLVANEPTGNLEAHRAALTKLFADNQNILSGPVLEELQKLGIFHKNGENYLLPDEIIKRTY